MRKPPGFIIRIARTSIIDYYRESGHKRDLSLDDENNPLDLPDETISCWKQLKKSALVSY